MFITRPALAARTITPINGKNYNVDDFHGFQASETTKSNTCCQRSHCPKR